jgi:AraC-like DNA-binding protein/DNA-binding XRE family transcriptional regulator
MDTLVYDFKLLKKARISQNISSDQMAFDLCLAERQIHSIENNLPDFFYSPTIKLACIKKYVEKLGLDIDEVLYKKESTKEESALENLTIEASQSTEGLVVNHESQVKTPKLIKSQAAMRHTKNGLKHTIIESSVEYIQQNLSNKITMADLTNLTAYSERSLQLVFKKAFNLSPFEYIEEQRLLKAKALIEAHKHSKKIAEIAQDVGLLHLGRFSVSFKKRFGVSPSLLAKA